MTHCARQQPTLGGRRDGSRSTKARRRLACGSAGASTWGAPSDGDGSRASLRGHRTAEGCEFAATKSHQAAEVNVPSVRVPPMTFERHESGCALDCTGYRRAGDYFTASRGNRDPRRRLKAFERSTAITGLARRHSPVTRTDTHPCKPPLCSQRSAAAAAGCKSYGSEKVETGPTSALPEWKARISAVHSGGETKYSNLCWRRASESPCSFVGLSSRQVVLLPATPLHDVPHRRRGGDL